MYIYVSFSRKEINPNFVKSVSVQSQARYGFCLFACTYYGSGHLELAFGIITTHLFSLLFETFLQTGRIHRSFHGCSRHRPPRQPSSPLLGCGRFLVSLLLSATSASVEVKPLLASVDTAMATPLVASARASAVASRSRRYLPPSTTTTTITTPAPSSSHLTTITAVAASNSSDLKPVSSSQLPATGSQVSPQPQRPPLQGRCRPLVLASAAAGRAQGVPNDRVLWSLLSGIWRSGRWR